jgi:uncharacterized protein with PQ loop repeat
MTILDVLTLLSYAALNIDVLLQIRRIYATKSSHDLSLTGMIVRYVAILIILIKFATLSDIPLIIGQALVAVTFTAYLCLAVTFVKHRKKQKS